MSPTTIAIWKRFANGANTTLDLGGQYPKGTVHHCIRRLIEGGHLERLGTIYVGKKNSAPLHVFRAVLENPPRGAVVEVRYETPRAPSVFHLAAHLHRDARMLGAVNESFRRVA